MSARPTCPSCGKRVADENALYQHSKRKHKGPAKHRAKAPARPERGSDSVASALVDALFDHAMGLPVDDYLLDMFPYEFDEAAP